MTSRWQEIVDEANLTRATFYLHYPDKAALLQAMTALRFGEMLKKRLIASPNCAGGLRAIALGVCEYLAKATGCPSSLSKMPLERSVIPVIEGLFREGAEDLRLEPGVDVGHVCDDHGMGDLWSCKPLGSDAQPQAGGADGRGYRVAGKTVVARRSVSTQAERERMQG